MEDKNFPLFTLARKNNTKELHIFNSKKVKTTCNVRKTSICKKMNWSEQDKIIFQCKTADEARKLSAVEGITVCGICVSSLYANY